MYSSDAPNKTARQCAPPTRCQRRSRTKPQVCALCSACPQRLRRIVVLGTTGSGKSTLARDLAQRLNAAYVELDAFRHGPNWQETPDDIFRQRARDAVSGDVWVVDGNYTLVRDIIWRRATTIVWLDYPFPLVFWRLFRRTMLRGVLRTHLWNGNREDLWRHFLTKDSLFYWAVKTHWRRRKTLPAAFALPDHAHLQVIRFRSAQDTRRWLEDISAVCAGDTPEMRDVV